MKKFVLAILNIFTLLCIALPMDAQKPFYIYRNDGQFNAFFLDEVDSITYSNYDLDSVFCDNIVVQTIFTQDSIYRIPLEAIDSVGFVQPKTEYSKEVRKIDELIPYITAVNGMSLTISSNVPQNIIPHVNEILLYEHFDKEMFPMGFAGRVAKVGNETIICDSVTLDDIYTRLIGIGKLIALNEQQPSYSRGAFVGNKAESIKISCPLVPDSLSNKIGLYGTIEGFLKYSLRIVYCHESNKKDYFSVTLSPGVGVGIEAGIKGKLEKDWITPKIDLVNVPIPDTPFLLKLKGGPAIRTSLEASISLRRELSWGCNLGVSYDNGNWKSFYEGEPKVPSDLEITGNMKGRFFAGYQTDFGIYSVGEIISIVKETEIGAEIVAEMGSDLLDSDNYEDLSKAKVDVNLLADFGVKGELKFAKLLKLTHRWDLASISVNLNSWSLVPTFSMPQVDLSTVNKSTVSVIPSGNLLKPLAIGLGVWDNKQNLLDLKYCPENYKDIEEWSYEKFQATFLDLKPGQEYVVSPIVSFWGKDRRALPHTKMVIEENIPASISSFKITDTYYSKNGFINQGKNYSFKFEAKTTVKLDNAENIEDWGYVYQDLNEDTVRISLRRYESPYTDSNYVYYRNTPISQATLYGYVKYYGDNNLYYGNKIDFPLVYKRNPEVATLDTTYVDETSARVKCMYKEAAPWGGTCGLEYWEEGNSDNPEILLFEAAQEEIEIPLNDLKPGTTYYYRAFIKIEDEYIRAEEIKSFVTMEAQICPDDHHPHLIDLGLPSGTKWSCCNVGASKPEDYGGYYAWGETETKEIYNEDNYKYYNVIIEPYWHVEEIYIGNNIAGSNYDVATVKWGNDWRMPNRQQCNEIKGSCKIKDSNYNGVKGSYIIGPNKNAIFLPYTGIYYNDQNSEVGLGGSYWSSVIDEIYPVDMSDYFHVSSVNIEYINNSPSYYLAWPYNSMRDRGLSVRPVSK